MCVCVNTHFCTKYYLLPAKLYQNLSKFSHFVSDVKFRVIRLRNAMTALLISDMHSKESCAQDEDDQDEGEKI